VQPGWPELGCAEGARQQAPAPSRPIDRGLPGPGLLAHVLVSKYADHLPLYRQSEIYAREGVDLDRSTLADWVGAASYLLSPLVDQLRKHVLAASKIHADDTPVPVLAPGTGKTKCRAVLKSENFEYPVRLLHLIRTREQAPCTYFRLRT